MLCLNGLALLSIDPRLSFICFLDLRPCFFQVLRAWPFGAYAALALCFWASCDGPSRAGRGPHCGAAIQLGGPPQAVRLTSTRIARVACRSSPGSGPSA